MSPPPSSSTPAFSVTSTVSTATTGTFEGPVALAKSHLALPQCPAALRSEPTLAPPARPTFNSRITSDRLRESCRVRTPFIMETKIRKGRKSIFTELDMDDPSPISPSFTATTPLSGPASPVLDDRLSRFGTGRLESRSNILSIPKVGDHFSVVSAPTSPMGYSHGKPRKALTLGTPPASRTVSFNLPFRAETMLDTYRKQPFVEEAVESELLEPTPAREVHKKRWFARSRPKLKTATSAPPPTLKSLAGVSPISHRQH